jgi:hypothetical protein
MIFYESGEQARRFLDARESLIALSGEIVRRSVARGEIRSQGSNPFR